jgi:hypothetical protein
MSTIHQHYSRTNGHSDTPPRSHGEERPERRPPRNMAAVADVLTEALRHNVLTDRIEIADPGASAGAR